MRGSRTWVATAVLFTGFLSGCATRGEFTDRTVPHSTSIPADKGTAAGSLQIDGPPHNTILNAPSTFNCRGEGAYADVFERQCESDSKTND
jgi:hypothetical protein